MADEARSLDIVIRSKVEMAGAKALEEQLQRDIGKAKALGQAHEDLAAKLKSVQASMAEARAEAKKHGEDLDEAGKKAERFGLSGRELKKAVHELGHEFPIAGQLMRAFLNPIGMAVTAAIAVFSHFKEKIAELNKSLDEMGADAAKPFGDMAGAMRTSAENAAVGIEKLKEELHKAGTAED